MSVAAPLARRPLRCCFQSTRRHVLRQFATATTTTSSPPAGTATASLPSSFQAIRDKSERVRTAFAVYGPPPRTTKPAESLLPPQPPSPAADPAQTTPASLAAHKVDVMRAYDRQQIARMDPTGARTRLFSRKNPNAAKPGDVLVVTPSKAGAEIFGGVFLAIRRSGIETAILLRGQLAKTGVEMWFKIYSRAVAAVDIIERRPRRARRAKLTYMRQPKHDRGSIEELVKNWRRARIAGRRNSAAGSKAGEAKGPQKFEAKSSRRGKK
ncbi:mitochondrial ribosomal protein [Sporothrix brasiliensis 5110]|uniref:Mitochondrial ribosomal protein n=1 Tax=Sporothrix brasiliensis 5110 TaxID=1398154 RepID=A0A0C2IRQ6_9PEZI|nr:mitochondrial ribosomal protein [Sporothrix brasiliensis 5110]KIH91706.1 mitochondrial ribosomal protein [Sporothrix brasiliensis 5110]